MGTGSCAGHRVRLVQTVDRGAHVRHLLVRVDVRCHVQVVVTHNLLDRHRIDVAIFRYYKLDPSARDMPGGCLLVAQRPAARA